MSIFKRKKWFYFYFPEVEEVFKVKAREEHEAVWWMLNLSINPYRCSYWKIITEEEYNKLKGKYL